MRADDLAAIGAISTTIGRISEESDAIAAAVREQESGTRSIARNIEAAAAGLRQSASGLNAKADHLRAEMRDFVTRLDAV